MSWFSGIPSRVDIARGHGFLSAGEAICDADPSQSTDWLETSADDWGATAVLIMARLQLDQMVEILQQFPGAAADDWRAGLLRAAAAVTTSGVDRDDLDCVIEGVALREALLGSTAVSHGLAIDGSISFTFGPSIPQAPTLGLQGSDSGEMNDEPLQIFGCAVTCTRAAARLVAAERTSGRNHG